MISRNILKNFLKKLKKSADWKNPRSVQKNVKLVTYFLKKGGTVKIERENFNQNFLWKYVRPLKYYFLKMKIRTIKLKEIELRLISNKWQIEKKSVVK
jgi:hypothetical protein